MSPLEIRGKLYRKVKRISKPVIPNAPAGSRRERDLTSARVPDAVLATQNSVRLGAQLRFDYADGMRSHMRSLSRPVGAGAFGMTSGVLSEAVLFQSIQTRTQAGLVAGGGVLVQHTLLNGLVESGDGFTESLLGSGLVALCQRL